MEDREGKQHRERFAACDQCLQYPLLQMGWVGDRDVMGRAGIGRDRMSWDGMGSMDGWMEMRGMGIEMRMGKDRLGGMG